MNFHWISTLSLLNLLKENFMVYYNILVWAIKLSKIKINKKREREKRIYWGMKVSVDSAGPLRTIWVFEVEINRCMLHCISIDRDIYSILHSNPVVLCFSTHCKL